MWVEYNMGETLARTILELWSSWTMELRFFLVETKIRAHFTRSDTIWDIINREPACLMRTIRNHRFYKVVKCTWLHDKYTIWDQCIWDNHIVPIGERRLKLMEVKGFVGKHFNECIILEIDHTLISHNAFSITIVCINISSCILYIFGFFLFCNSYT